VELLDVYRGLAIVVVMLFHYTARLPDDYLRLQDPPPTFGSGHLGVQAFFAISGFCIFLTISRASSLSDFFAKRFARLWPALIVCALITQLVVTSLGLPGREIGWSQWPGSVLMLNDFGVPWVDGAYWSLLVEIKYYLLFAFTYRLARQNVFEGLVCLFAFSALGVLAARHWAAPDLEHLLEVMLIPSHLPWFMLGVAFYSVFTGLRSLRVVVAAIVTVIASFVLYGDAAIEKTFVLVLVTSGFAALLRYPDLRLPRLVRYFGLISFPLYLLHQNIGYVAIRELAWLIPDTCGRILAASLVVIALAHVVHVGVEFRYKLAFETGFLRLASILDRHARRLLGFS
jgi:peptidoglycan/LPS O-acetylase OafA/YrhL